MSDANKNTDERLSEVVKRLKELSVPLRIRDTTELNGVRDHPHEVMMQGHGHKPKNGISALQMVQLHDAFNNAAPPLTPVSVAQILAPLEYIAAIEIPKDSSEDHREKHPLLEPTVNFKDATRNNAKRTMGEQKISRLGRTLSINDLEEMRALIAEAYILIEAQPVTGFFKRKAAPPLRGEQSNANIEPAENVLAFEQ